MSSWMQELVVSSENKLKHHVWRLLGSFKKWMFKMEVEHSQKDKQM